VGGLDAPPRGDFMKSTMLCVKPLAFDVGDLLLLLLFPGTCRLFLANAEGGMVLRGEGAVDDNEGEEEEFETEICADILEEE